MKYGCIAVAVVAVILSSCVFWEISEDRTLNEVFVGEQINIKRSVLYENHLYIPCSDNLQEMVKVLDVSDPVHPETAAEYSPSHPDTPEWISISHFSDKDFALIVYRGLYQIDCLDVTEPENPVCAFEYKDGPISGSIMGFSIKEDYLFVLNSENTITVHDINDFITTESLHVYGSIMISALPENFSSENVNLFIDEDGDTLLFCNNTRVFICDISNKAAPELSSSKDFKEFITADGIEGDLIIVDTIGDFIFCEVHYIDWETSFIVIDISDPAAPEFVKTIFSKREYSYYYSGNYFFIRFNNQNEIRVYDISDPTKPSKEGSIMLGTSYGINNEWTISVGPYLYNGTGGNLVISLIAPYN